jgi:hypothetical protein
MRAGTLLGVSCGGHATAHASASGAHLAAHCQQHSVFSHMSVCPAGRYAGEPTTWWADVTTRPGCQWRSKTVGSSRNEVDYDDKN